MMVGKYTALTALIITAHISAMVIIGGCGWVVFAMDQSGWWFLLAVFLSAGVAPYTYKLANAILFDVRIEKEAE